ncbi:hypothetical protein DXA11_27095, partial [Bacteroides sp. AM56-10ce]
KMFIPVALYFSFISDKKQNFQDRYKVDSSLLYIFSFISDKKQNFQDRYKVDSSLLYIIYFNDLDLGKKQWEYNSSFV